MLDLIRKLRDKWNNWTGDRELEFAIRRHLSANGHFGGTAKLQNVKLAAVQRPGWLQVYRFDAIAKVNDQSQDDEADHPPRYVQLYGLVREDVRHDMTTIRTFEDPEHRRELFAQWSDDLIQLRGGRALS